jgi:hypothetical protein
VVDEGIVDVLVDETQVWPDGQMDVVVIDVVLTDVMVVDVDVDGMVEVDVVSDDGSVVVDVVEPVVVVIVTQPSVGSVSNGHMDVVGGVVVVVEVVDVVVVDGLHTKPIGHIVVVVGGIVDVDDDIEVLDGRHV